MRYCEYNPKQNQYASVIKIALQCCCYVTDLRSFMQTTNVECWIFIIKSILYERS